MASHRALVLVAALALVVAPLTSKAQQPGRVHRIGLLSGGSMKTAKSLGLPIPPSVFLRAHQVIE